MFMTLQDCGDRTDWWLFLSFFMRSFPSVPPIGFSPCLWPIPAWGYDLACVFVAVFLAFVLSVAITYVSLVFKSSSALLMCFISALMLARSVIGTAVGFIRICSSSSCRCFSKTFMYSIELNLFKQFLRTFPDVHPPNGGFLVSRCSLISATAHGARNPCRGWGGDLRPFQIFRSIRCGTASVFG